MVCGEVKVLLLAPDGEPAPAVLEHLQACPPCSQLAEALLRLDSALQAELSRRPATDLQASLASALASEAVRPRSAADLKRALRGGLVVPSPSPERAGGPSASEARLDAALRAGLVVEPPAALHASLASLASRPTEARVDAMLRAGLVVEPPETLQASLASLTSRPAEARVDAALRTSLVVEPPMALQARLRPLALTGDGLGWLPSLWQTLRARPAVLAGQLAALAVLAYAVVQLVSWLGTLPVVVGDIPYAFELLALSPAVDVLGQLEGVLQQLGLWLLIGAAGWLLAQSMSWRPNEPAS